jgi:putative ABC transport system permease protein
MLAQIATMALANLRTRRLRTGLTVLGIAIGIAAIVGMVGAVQGITSNITGELSSLHSDIIEVIPGNMQQLFSPLGGTAASLSERDVDEISRVSGVRIASGIVTKSATVDYNNQILSLSVHGVDPETYKELDTYGLAEGRYLESGDEYSVMLGWSAAHDVFKKDIELKKLVTIEGKDFRVVGIVNKVGGVFQQLDSTIYMPKRTARQILDLNEKDVSSITVKVADGYDPETVGNDIKDRLAKLHKIKVEDADFTVITPNFIQGITNQISGLMQVLLGGIAGISLVVGGIGIANMMFTNVRERVREIGIMKSLGATDRNVMTIFLFESGIVGIIGGVIGIVLGIVLGEGFLVARQVLMSSFQTFSGAQTTLPSIEVSPMLIFGSLGFSFVVGVLAGYFPARWAARLQPVEALRYE